MIGDEHSLYWRLSGGENLAFFAALHGLRRSEALRDSAELLDLVGLAEAAERPVRGYSSGMRARLSLARALLAGPPLLLLDEPTRSLDPLAAAEFREMAVRLTRERRAGHPPRHPRSPRGRGGLRSRGRARRRPGDAGRECGGNGARAARVGVPRRRADAAGRRRRPGRAMKPLMVLAAFVRRDWRIDLSYRATFVLRLIATVLSLALFYYLSRIIDDAQFAAREDLDSGYFGYVAVGLSLLRIVQVGLASFSRKLREEQTTGTFEALMATPASPGRSSSRARFTTWPARPSTGCC